MSSLIAQPITAEAFAPYGEVIQTEGAQLTLINDGLCHRFSDLASFDIEDGRAGLSFFRSQLRPMPYRCDLLERHPLGSQCFIPMSDAEFLLIVAPDNGGKPGPLTAFLATNNVAVNIARNTWHGVLAPLAGSGLFAVIDRIGTETNGGQNLEEHLLEEAVFVKYDL